MKYYCENCGSEFIPAPTVFMPTIKDGEYSTVKCPVCCKRSKPPYLVKLPAFETVADWEKRTGREYPDTAPVYINIGANKVIWAVCDNGDIAQTKDQRIVATEAGAPPDNWRPE